MKQKNTYNSWNFESIWEISENSDYPKLKKESNSDGTEEPKAPLSSGEVPKGNVNYKYDKAGRLVEVAYETGLKIKYVYDAGGNITEITKTN